MQYCEITIEARVSILHRGVMEPRRPALSLNCCPECACVSVKSPALQHLTRCDITLQLASFAPSRPFQQQFHCHRLVIWLAFEQSRRQRD